ncbi:MAG: hypothetical protein GXO91_06815 [FCB group bacterium]|nr:hypothetical protein [FCB group bacterium]
MKIHKIKLTASRLLLLAVISAAGFSQFNPELNPNRIETNSGPGFMNSVMNPNRFQMNQSVSFTAVSGGGMSGSVGIFSNYLNYRISDKMNFSAGLHLIKPSFSTNFGDLQKPVLNYDLQFDYKFSENFRMQFNLIKMNPAYYSPVISRYGLRP